MIFGAIQISKRGFEGLLYVGVGVGIDRDILSSDLEEDDAWTGSKGRRRLIITGIGWTVLSALNCLRFFK